MMCAQQQQHALNTSNLLSSLFNVLTAKVNLTAVASDTVQLCLDKATVEYVQDTSEILYFALDFTMSGIHSGESYCSMIFFNKSYLNSLGGQVREF